MLSKINISVLLLDKSKRIINYDSLKINNNGYFDRLNNTLRTKLSKSQHTSINLIPYYDSMSFDTINKCCICTLYNYEVPNANDLIKFDHATYLEKLLQVKKADIIKETRVIENDNIDTDDMDMIIEEYNVQHYSTNFVGEQGYLDLLTHVLDQDHHGRQTRNAKTYSTFGVQLEFDLADGFPLLTTKRVNFKNIFSELIMFIRGETSVKALSESGNKIWDKNTTRQFLDSRGLVNYPEYEMGPMYGYVWRFFGKTYEPAPTNALTKVYTTILGFTKKIFKTKINTNGFDQLHDMVKTLMTDPHSRRMLMTTFHPSTIDQCVLAPCHGIVVQIYVRDDKFLDLKMYQRSADLFLGLPYNIASYSLLLHLLCEICNFTPGKVIITLGDAHIYDDHINAVQTQLARQPKALPKLVIKKGYNLNSNPDDAIEYMSSMQYDDLEIVDYCPEAFIKAEMIA